MKKKVISALLSVAMISSLLIGCSSNNAEAPAEKAEASAETEKAEEPAKEAETSEASAEAGSVYYLNFKPEVDEQ